VNNFLKLGFIHYTLDVHTLLEFSLFHIPPAADVIVPVTCVEAGRWNRQSRGFSSLHARTTRRVTPLVHLSAFGCEMVRM